MPAEGVSLTAAKELLSSDELVQLAAIFASEGVDKIRFTGGEPLVRADAEEVIERIGGIAGIRTLAITTNGLLLRRKLARLLAAGLTQLNISLDTLDAGLFTRLTRRNGHERVLEAIADAVSAADAAASAGRAPLRVKINCVVMRGVNDHELEAFARLTLRWPVEVRFIEYMPFSGNQWSDSKMMSLAHMRQAIEEALVLPNGRAVRLLKLVDQRSDTGRAYTLPPELHPKGTISFIASMSEPFCGGCNRLRLTADGNLKVCLFGKSEVSLRDIIRDPANSPEKIKSIIQAAVWSKKAAHAGMYEIAKGDNRPMILIGG